MKLGLEGRVAVVTGASRGIGLGIASGLGGAGCRVLLVARGEDGLREAVAGLRAAGREATTLAVDVTGPEAPVAIVEAAEAAYGPVDVLVNNVGGNRRGEFLETSDEDWSSVLDLNLGCHVRVTRLVARGMADRGRGAIVFVGSIFGREAGGPGLSIYNATKSALTSLSKILALELAPRGVRVNTVAPGSIRFPGGSWDRRCVTDPDGMAAFVAANLPIGRFGSVEEVADVVTFLASDRASLVTGACLNVDGGQSRSLI